MSTATAELEALDYDRLDESALSRNSDDSQADCDFLRLFSLHQDGIRAYIRSMVRDPATADDVFQETSMVLWREFDKYDKSRSFTAWGRGIASHKVLKAYAKRHRNTVALSPEAIEAVAVAFDQQEADMEEERIALRSCYERIPEHTRKLIALRYGDEHLSIAQLAERVSRSHEAVHKALVRIRAALAKCIGLRLRRDGDQ